MTFHIGLTPWQLNLKKESLAADEVRIYDLANGWSFTRLLAEHAPDEGHQVDAEVMNRGNSVRADPLIQLAFILTDKWFPQRAQFIEYDTQSPDVTFD